MFKKTKYKQILYYLRLLLFITSMIFIFLTIKNYIMSGIIGYLFFIVEFLYIIVILITLLSKKSIFINDKVFNGMNIGIYLYQIIISIRVFSFPISRLIPGSINFYRVNYMILIALLTILIIYSFVIKNESNKKSR